MSRILRLTASVCLTLAVAVPAFAQGKSGGKKPVKTATPPPSSSALSTPTGGQLAIGATASPFSWLDDASVLEPGNILLGVSMLQWHGAGVSETIFPVIDATIGLTPRVQFGANVPRVAGGLGTTFFSAKIGVLQDEVRGLSRGGLADAGDRRRRGLEPHSERRRAYPLGSACQRAPRRREHAAVRQLGLLLAWNLVRRRRSRRVTRRSHGPVGFLQPGVDIVINSTNRSRGRVAAPHRNYRRSVVQLHPNMAVFTSLSRTLGMSADLGGGTTFGFGMSLSAAVPTR